MPDDFISQLKTTAAKRGPLADPLETVTAQDVARTTTPATPASTQAGNYVRRTFTYRPEQLESVERIAAELNVSVAQVARWLLDVAVDAYNAGQRPLMEQVLRISE